MTAKYSTSFLIVVLLFQQLLGGLTFPIAKYGLALMEPFTFAFYRYLIASAVLMIVVRFMRHKLPIARSDWWKIIGLGIIIIPINQTLYMWGQSLTGAGHGSVLFATAPIWMVLAALVHLKERLQWKRTLGIVIAVAGVMTIVTGGALELGREYLWGDLLILIAVIAWCYYTIFGKNLVRKYGALRITAYALSIGSLIYTPFGLYMASQFDHSAVTAGVWLSILYTAIITSIVVYGLWYWVLKYWEASRIAAYHNIMPIVATGVAFVWLGEPMGISFVAGGIITLAGVIVAEL